MFIRSPKNGACLSSVVISLPRYCRFIVTGSDLSTRLPMEETRLASVNAPTLQIVEVKVSTSISKIDVTCLTDVMPHESEGVFQGVFVPFFFLRGGLYYVYFMDDKGWREK